MSSLQEVAHQQIAMNTIVNLTGVFEGLASMRISQTKNQVLESQQFFDVLWKIYSQIRVDQLFRFGRTQDEQPIDKELLIVITSEGAFSGDIDQRLIRFLMEDYDPRKHDIVVIGHHGAVLLTQQEVKFNKYFTLPKKDTNINVVPLLREVRNYKSAAVYYQTYISLMQQDMKRIELNSAVQAKGKAAGSSDEIISEMTYIFEPSTYEVVAHLERSMTQIALSQVILESKLAQYASRFRAMSVSNDRAEELTRDLNMEFHRTKRRIQDERLKEIINGLKASSQ
jgi:ATP synthase F1 gamma subunit